MQPIWRWLTEDLEHVDELRVVLHERQAGRPPAVMADGRWQVRRGELFQQQAQDDGRHQLPKPRPCLFQVHTVVAVGDGQQAWLAMLQPVVTDARNLHLVLVK